MRRGLASQQGSVLLGALMMLLVLSILGIALFDTALIDSQLAMASVDDYRALESAEAGMQRALHRLYRHLCGGDAACLNPAVQANWAGATIDGAAVSAAAFAPFIPQTMSFRGTFADPRGAGYPPAEYSGTYAVEIKQITSIVAKTILGLPCLPGNVVPTGEEPCPALLYMRSRGTFGRTAAEQVSQRVIQAVVQARAPSAAILAEIITGSGSPEVHGSLHMVPCGAATCSPLVLSAGPGIRNNYTGMPPDLQAIVPKLPVIACQPTAACAGLEVETLEAAVRIGKPPTDSTFAVNIQSAGASLGEAGAGSNNPVTGIRGKPTMDGIYLGGGCAPVGFTPPCSDMVGTNPGNVYPDGPVRANDIEPPPVLARVPDRTTVLGLTYDGWAACGPGVVPGNGPGTCNSTGALAGGGVDFFIAHAHVISAGTNDTEDPLPDICDAAGNSVLGPAALDPLGGNPCNPPPLGRLFRTLTGQVLAGEFPWTASTPTFRKTFDCGSAGLPCYDASNARVNGWVANSGVAPARYLQLEWRGPDWTKYPEYTAPGAGYVGDQPGTLVIFQCATPNCGCAPTTCVGRWVLSPGAAGLPPGGIPGTQPTDPVRPAMIYVNGSLKLCESCVDATFWYRGHLAILTNGAVGDDTPGSERGSIVIDTGLRALCESSSCGVPSGWAIPTTQASFPQRSLLTLYTPGNIFAFASGSSAAVPALVGRFHAQRHFRIGRQIDIAGATAAATFDIRSQVPRFWEVQLPLTLTALPLRGPQIQPPRFAPRWTVATAKWKECQGLVTNQPC